MDFLKNFYILFWSLLNGFIFLFPLAFLVVFYQFILAKMNIWPVLTFLCDLFYIF